MYFALVAVIMKYYVILFLFINHVILSISSKLYTIECDRVGDDDAKDTHNNITRTIKYIIIHALIAVFNFVRTV